ncbi:unnamed protein product [Brassicogethes aeneus]|uniref:Uncharacterized protein n=1 Tax=Brassicogethes aeneus TaxID=1431903 RepID=A0A9P0BD97_BRAAE|nr:unnamed protein product [Brassicogethes aeneus]
METEAETAQSNDSSTKRKRKNSKSETHEHKNKKTQAEKDYPPLPPSTYVPPPPAVPNSAQTNPLDDSTVQTQMTTLTPNKNIHVADNYTPPATKKAAQPGPAALDAKENIPPIVLRMKNRWTMISKEISRQGWSFNKATNIHDGIKFQPTDINSFRKKQPSLHLTRKNTILINCRRKN